MKTLVSVVDIENAIAHEFYVYGAAIQSAGVSVLGPAERRITNPTAELNRLTLCVLILANGFVVTGKSACVDLSNFDAAEGRRYAREDAIGQCWPLLGYALRERLATSNDING